MSPAAFVRRWRAEHENAGARLEIASRNERAAHLLSQREPVATIGIDRERLRLILAYLAHGDPHRLNREFTQRFGAPTP